ncbi:ABC transporter substrate-binding protein [Bradyrhizobium prioriisuperbiae]|uniref:ABC transporter substrate-binding protein n=1 Tax=Bradyrhizobium prioriisuperbiae TaxID=2854389 RepID=UPI0028ED125E|nr:ABC transporter substrate-binding protein [Bradyrhizobium prioritasuperba]
MTLSRREFVGAATGAGIASMAAPGLLFAQSNGPFRIGLLAAKTGPLASGGIDMELALNMFLKERNGALADRKIELIVADTAGVPATARTKCQELVEKNNIDCLIGPLAAFEALAINDYVVQKEIPTIGVAAAEDMTQRQANPWFVRVTATAAQCAYPLAEYAAKELKYKRMVTMADDFAYGHEMCAGFQRVFEDNGGKIIQKIFPPLTAPDYGSYVASIKNADAIFLGTAGSNGFRFLRQFIEYGLKDKMAVIGGMTALDESVLRNMGDEALGIVTTSFYSAELDNKANQAFAPAFRKQNKYDPGYYAASTYIAGEVLEAALKTTTGKARDKKALIGSIRGASTDTIRGVVKFDEFGNIIGNAYIRKVTRKDGRLVNSVVKTYPDVSQFWTYDKTAFLKNPVYSRDYPPAKNLEP